MRLDVVQRTAQEQFARQSHNYGAGHILAQCRVRLCEASGLLVESAELKPMKQPDLEWYFDTAATSSENRERVRKLIATAPASARHVFRLAEEDAKSSGGGRV